MRLRISNALYGLSVDVSEDTGSIMADEQKIKQVILNLLGNAFKFTPDGGSVFMRARKLSSSDTGIGIAPENMGKLFQPFQQIESSLTKRFEGTGLGLSLCKNFVELHGGRIWAESEVGKGSKFIFIIPVRQNTESRIQESE